MQLYLIFPGYGCDHVMKNSTTRRGNQTHQCRVRLWRGEALCSRQLVEHLQWKPIDPDRNAMHAFGGAKLYDCLSLEKISLAGVARVMNLLQDWLQRYVNRCCAQVPQTV